MKYLFALCYNSLMYISITELPSSEGSEIILPGFESIISDPSDDDTVTWLPKCTSGNYNNIRGLLGISKDRSDRMKAISTALNNGRFDIVCLQELWLENDFNTIRKAVAEVLPYSHYFYSGVTGSGLCILSRWPFEAIMFHQWPLNGYIHKIFHGDWFGGKGVGLCRIIAQGFPINIYTTHLHAQYNTDDDEYLAHRVVQAFDTAQFVRLTSDAAHISILAGDLNTQPEELCHQLIQHTAQLSDAYDAHTDDSATGTYGCSRNSYADSKCVANNPHGERIDHIFYKAGLGAKVVVESYSMPLEERVPDSNFSYSDHEAIAAKFKISAATNHNVPDCIIRNKKELRSALDLGLTVINEAQERIYWDKICYWSITTALILGIITISIFSDIPQSYSRTYQITLVTFTAIIIFSSIMATVWNQIEMHGLLSTHKTMQVLLDRVITDQPDLTSDHILKNDDLELHVHQRTVKGPSNP